MKKLILFFVLLFFVPHIYTQSTKIDSLQNLLKTAKEDTNKVSILNKLSVYEFTLNYNSDKSISLSNEAILLAKQINDTIGLSEAYHNLGVFYNTTGSFKESISCYKKSLELRELIGDEINISKILHNLGRSYMSSGDYKTALNYLYKSQKIKEETGDKKGMGITLNAIGETNMHMKNYENALNDYFKSLPIREELKDYKGVSTVLSNIGLTYYYLKNYDSSLFYLNEALIISEKFNYKSGTAGIRVNLGLIYDDKNDKDKALMYYSLALETFKELDFKQQQSIILHNISTIFQEKGEYEKAIQNLNKSLQIAIEIDSKEDIKIAYQTLSEVYSQIKNHEKSLHYYKAFVNMKDSIMNADIASQISELQIQYETEKKDQQIALLEKEKQITDIETKRKNILIASSVGGFVLVMLMLFLFYNRQQLKKQNLLQQAINSKQKELTSAVVKGQDEERKRIAKDLHDGLGTLLSTARINVNTLEDKIPTGNENKKLFDNALQIIDKLNSEVRHIAQNLMPETLNEFGLVAAVEELIDTINQTGKLKISFKYYELSNELEKQLEITLYRIIQEIVNNTIKHSKATELSIELVQHEDSMVLLTEDNGIGFDSENQIQTGMGLKNIQVRLNVLNGALNIDSNPNNGTTISIEIPLLG